MNKIIIGFSKPNKWKLFSWLIMSTYNTPYAHVFVRLYSNKYQKDLIYQASQLMVNFMGSETFLSHNEVYKEFEVEITPEKEFKLMQFAIDNAGKPYGLSEALGLGIVRLLSLIGVKAQNPFRDGCNSFVCSALAAEVLKHFAENNYDKDPEDTSPLDLFNYLNSR